ncbi:hypothetical protein [Breoghania sp.]|uniref:hypothetical protein n=1 Tax=Breoghania sp. TaxID=2065378 RepID=UPI0029CA5ADE|nr:hypothetical protein [Breoghania sp.]
MKHIAAATTCLLAFVLYAFAQSGEAEMRRVECAKLIVYTPITTTSDEQVCSGFGGLTASKTDTRGSLTILVKDLLVGGDEGLQMAALPETTHKH